MHPWLWEYYLRMTEIIKVIELIHKLAAHSKENRGTDYNIERTTVNYVMCSLDNKSLTATEQKIEVGALVFGE